MIPTIRLFVSRFICKVFGHAGFILREEDNILVCLRCRKLTRVAAIMMMLLVAGPAHADPYCVAKVYSDMIVNGTSDIDVMERCHATTVPEIRSVLFNLMRMSARGRPIGPTPFKDAHCEPTYSGFACEYNGVVMELTTR